MAEEQTWEVLSMIVGTLVLAVAMHHAVYFAKRPGKLAMAYAINLVGEAASNLGVLAFAVLDWHDQLPHIPVAYRAFIRIAIFTLALGATCHLSYRIHQIEEGAD